MIDNKRGENAIAPLKRLGEPILRVEAGQSDAHQQEQRKLNEHDKSAQDQRPAGIAPAAGAQVPLDHHLVGAVCAQTQEHAADQAGPERVRTREVRGQVEHAELFVVGCKRRQLLPASRQLVQHDGKGDDSSHQIDHELNAIVPDDRLHAAEARVDDRQYADYEHTDRQRQSDRFFQHDGRQEESQPVCQIASYKKQDGGGLFGARAEPSIEDLVGGEKISTEVVRQQQNDHQNAPDDEAQRQLQEAQVASGGERNSRNAEKCNRAGFCGHDRAEQHPPRHVAPAEQIVGKALLPFADPQPERNNAGQVGEYDCRIDCMDGRLQCQSVSSRLRIIA